MRLDEALGGGCCGVEAGTATVYGACLREGAAGLRGAARRPLDGRDKVPGFFQRAAVASAPPLLISDGTGTLRPAR
jgi:hypothetical protein